MKRELIADLIVIALAVVLLTVGTEYSTDEVYPLHKQSGSREWLRL